MEQSASLFACHQLIDEYGRRHTASIIKVSGNDSCAQYECAFDYTERASVAWMGGTIILTSGEEPPVRQGETLNHYIGNFHAQKRGADNGMPVHAWHTPQLDADAPLASPLILLQQAQS